MHLTVEEHRLFIRLRRHGCECHRLTTRATERWPQAGLIERAGLSDALEEAPAHDAIAGVDLPDRRIEHFNRHVIFQGPPTIGTDERGRRHAGRAQNSMDADASDKSVVAAS